MTDDPTARPCRHLAEYGRRYPECWRQFDGFRARRGNTLPQWPDWCFCPQTGAFGVVRKAGAIETEQGKWDVGVLAALAAWRPTQGVYVFDPTVFDAVWTTPITGEIPSEVVYRLPDWCVWIDTQNRTWFGGKLRGFFAHLDYEDAENASYLSFVLDGTDSSDTDHLLGFRVPLSCGNLAQSIMVAEDGTLRRHAVEGGQTARPTERQQNMAGEFAALVSLVLYLCSQAAELTDPSKPATRPTRPEPKKVKSGWRLFPPERPRIWRVGDRLGEAIRRAEGAERAEPTPGPTGSHASPRPHIRRAHWHAYWTGPKSDLTARALVLKWLPPIPVNLTEEDST